MNIFVTSKDPATCARALDNLRLNKMILETTQLLSTAHRVLDKVGVLEGEPLYKLTHANHPCSVWLRVKQGNYQWLWKHLKALHAERHYRTGKSHASGRLCGPLKRVPKNIKAGKVFSFINCSKFPELPVIEAYRKTMRSKWANDKRTPGWGKRGKPGWAKAGPP